MAYFFGPPCSNRVTKCIHTVSFHSSRHFAQTAQRNETEAKQFRNSFETVSKLFWRCFVSVSFRCADSLTTGGHALTCVSNGNSSSSRFSRKHPLMRRRSYTVASPRQLNISVCQMVSCGSPRLFSTYNFGFQNFSHSMSSMCCSDWNCIRQTITILGFPRKVG